MPSPSRFALSTAALLAVLSAAASCGKKEAQAPAGHLPDPVTADDMARAKGGGRPDAVVIDFKYLYEDKEHARRTQLNAARAEPGAQGTQVLTRPEATIALAPHRVLVLTAPKATFTMPGNQPRDGLFSGSAKDPVVFTLYECEEGKTPRLSGTDDVRMKVFFDGDARFDLERDAVSSSGPVQITGKTVDFRGTGLQLTWNRLDRRMEQLDIDKGQILRYREEEKKSDAAPAKAARKADAADPAEVRSLFRPGARDLTLYWSGPLTLRPVEPADGAPPEAQGQAKAKTRYDATLTGNVRGHVGADKPEDEAVFTAEKLDTQFALDAPREGQDAKKDGAPLAAAPLAGENTLTLAGTDAAPASVRKMSGETISAAALSYSTGSGRVAARGSERAPILMRTPEGWLTGTRLDLDPGTGKAVVMGPGRMESSASALRSDKSGAKGAPADAPISASYADHIEMDFTVAPAKAGQSPTLGDPLETRLFGSVAAAHPDFTLACGRLAIAFAADAEGKNKRIVPTRVDVSENAEISLRDRERGEVKIKSPSMRLALDHRRAETYPTGFTAAGPVEAVQGDGSTLTCNRLDVDFTAPDKAAKDAKPAVAALHAAGNAHYAGKADGKQAVLDADRFTVDAQKNTLELVGSAQKWATVESQGMGLAGPQVSLQKEGGVARVAGPGRLTLLTKEKEHLVLSWQGKMGWNDAQGLGYFEKAVECAADAPGKGESTLHADDSLRLQVDPAGKDGAAPGTADRQLRLADARGKVVFTGAQRDSDGKLVGRARIDGPVLLVRNDVSAKNPQGDQTVTVDGKGVMLVENFQGNGDQPNAAFSGQGATSFLWTKSMVMDVARNDLHLLNNVVVRHLQLKDNGQYAPMAEAVTLTCQEAHADLTESGGLGGLHGKQAQDKAVEMREMKADYGVEIQKSDVTIRADHLLYEGAKHAAQLWCKPPRLVELLAKGQEIPATAERVTWRVDQNKLEVEHPAGGMLPQWK